MSPCRGFAEQKFKQLDVIYAKFSSHNQKEANNAEEAQI